MHRETDQEISAAHSRVHWTAAGILDLVGQHCSSLLAVRVRRIGLFGCYGRGSPTAGRDMGFLVGRERPFFSGLTSISGSVIPGGG